MATVDGSQALAALIISVAVSAVWIASIVVGFIEQDFSGAQLCTVIMAPVAAYLWGVRIIRRNGANS